MAEFLKSPAGLNFALLLFGAAALLYFCKHLTESLDRRRSRQARAERFLSALYAEIDANVAGLRDFLDRSPPPARLSEAGAHPRYAGVVHSLVYESHLGNLAGLPNAAVAKTVAFYSQIERVPAILDAFDRSSYAGLLPEERQRLVEELFRSVERGEKLGRAALHALEVNVPITVMRRALVTVPA
jgi:hypothetical protein